MAMSASLARRELDVQRYPLIVVVLVPLLAIFLQALIPRFIPKFDILDLPLLVTIYFSVGWRNPIAGTVTGAVIGIIQDALTSRPLGINGISQCVVGFFAASLGVKIDVENPGTRLLINFAFTLLNIGIYLFIMHRMLVLNVRTNWLHEVIKAVINSIIGVFFFDILHRDGIDLLDAPTSERAAALDDIVPAQHRVDRLITSDPVAAGDFLDATLASGHEGVMAKSLTAPYEAGRRGAGWLKVKPVHTLDLVVLAVEWGSGRRRGKLSNIHLAARDPATGGYVMLGKTFKGMTDAMLDWQTARFQELAVGPTDGYLVQVRPEQVVEVAFDGVQTSSRYPGGLALRFARVLRYRDDKGPDQADTIDAVRALHRG